MGIAAWSQTVVEADAVEVSAALAPHEAVTRVDFP